MDDPVESRDDCLGLRANQALEVLTLLGDRYMKQLEASGGYRFGAVDLKATRGPKRGEGS